MRELPELKLARRVIQRHSLEPPVPIESLIEKYASLERHRIPFEGVDGLTLNLKRPGYRPTVIVNIGRPATRVRFTLAHELGHIIIPWHLGSIVDVTSRRLDENDVYSSIEAEANRFASELLMPTAWIRTLLTTYPDPNALVRGVARQAQTSLQAALIKVPASLPAGFVYARVRNGRVTDSGRSPNTASPVPPTGSDPETLFNFGQRWTGLINGERYVWWRFSASDHKLVSEEDDDWRHLLEKVLGDIDLSFEDRRKFVQSLNGIVGISNGQLKEGKTAEAVFSACMQRIRMHALTRDDYRAASEHPVFERYLAAKVRSLA